MTETSPYAAPRLALVGDRSPSVRAHARISELLAALAERDHLVVDPYWVPTPDAAAPGALDRFDAVWLVPGSPYASETGAVSAVRSAREQGIPFLGTCGGFQHAVLEYARHVCGMARATHAENEPAADEALIVPLTCSLVGHEGRVTVTPGTLAERILGAGNTLERYHCSYGLDPSHLDTLQAHGLRVSGTDEAGEARIVELPGQPFFLATLYQPELAGDGTRPHAIVRAFVTAAADHASAAAA